MRGAIQRIKEIATDLNEKFYGITREISYHEELRTAFYLLLSFIMAVLVIKAGDFFFSGNQGAKNSKGNSRDESLRIRELKVSNSNNAEEKEGKSDRKEENQKIIYVCISGAVLKPGVYELKEGDRLIRVIELAGARKDAAINFMNLAEPLSDGEMIYVPTIEEAEKYGFKERILQSGIIKDGYRAGTLSNSSAASAATQKININTAGKEELCEIPGVGEKTAEKIIAFREKNGPFRSADDLLKIEGIGKKKLEKMRDYISF